MGEPSARDPEPASSLAEELSTLIEARSAKSREGLFGPESLVWRVDRELALLFGGGRALLLQLAHPAVAAGVAHHSDYERDPLGRSRRTFDAVYEITFADLPTALRAGARIRARHTTVRGTIEPQTSERLAGAPYDATSPPLLFWVLATLLDTSLRCYELLVAELTEGERERYYAESRRNAVVYGIPSRALPATYADFKLYFDAMVRGPAIQVGPTARRIAEVLLRQPPSAFLAGIFSVSPGPLVRLSDAAPIRALITEVGQLSTSMLLPERLADEYGLPHGEARARRFDYLVRSLRALIPRLPERVRCSPHYLAAKARLEEGRSIDRGARSLLA